MRPARPKRERWEVSWCFAMPFADPDIPKATGRAQCHPSPGLLRRERGSRGSCMDKKTSNPPGPQGRAKPVPQAFPPLSTREDPRSWEAMPDTQNLFSTKEPKP